MKGEVNIKLVHSKKTTAIFFCILILGAATIFVNMQGPKVTPSEEELYLIEKLFRIYPSENTVVNDILIGRHQRRRGFEYLSIYDYPGEYEHAAEAIGESYFIAQITVPTRELNDVVRTSELFFEYIDSYVDPLLLSYYNLSDKNVKEVYKRWSWMGSEIVLSTGEPFLFEATRYSTVVVSKSRFGRTMIIMESLFTSDDLKDFHNSALEQND